MDNLIDKWLYDPVIGKMVLLVIGFVIIWSLTSFVKSKFLGKIKDTESRYRSRKLASVFGYFITIVFVTIVFSEKLGSLTVALGVAGAGIAFALQEVIASVAGWMAIMFGGFYRVGDRVQLGGTRGDVIDIGVLRTTLMETGQWVDGDLYNGRIVLVANSFVFKEPVFNYSADFPFLWDEIKLPIQYGSDYKFMQKLLEEIANDVVGEFSTDAKKTWPSIVDKYMIEDASTDPMITLVINDNWVEFTLRYTVNYKSRRATKNKLFHRILESVEESKDKVKFASATFHLVEAPDFNVHIKS